MNPEVLCVLERYNAAFCVYELAGYHSPFTVTADFAYVRLHGPAAGNYEGSYSDKPCGGWASRIEAWAREVKAIYIYFDNDQAGYAAHNALTLKEMVLGKSQPEAA